MNGAMTCGCILAALGLAAATPAAGNQVHFEEFTGLWYGADGSGGFTSQGVFFENTYTDYGGGFFAWSGWAVSNHTDTTTPGYGNQFSAITGGGAAGSAFYGVSFVVGSDSEPTVLLPARAEPVSMQITNTTYAALSMLHGDGFAKKFGGTDGHDPDWFKLTVTGLDDGGASVGTVELYLADYRFEDDGQDYIVQEWTDLDLTPLAAARALRFELSSSDVGTYGINTPAYFAMDNLVFVPEPTSALLLLGAAGLLRRRVLSEGKGAKAR
jgi:hypothetical protein